jgi:hypothetical protein
MSAIGEIEEFENSNIEPQEDAASIPPKDDFDSDSELGINYQPQHVS